MGAYVCTIAGGKGGVGRTTTAINLGVVFEEGGYDTVLVDADLGMTNVGKMLAVESDETLHDVLGGNAAVSDALTGTEHRLSVIAGDGDLEAYANADPANLRGVIETLQESFDVVLVDTSPKISHEMAVPVGLADGTLLVSTADRVALTDAGRTADFADRVDGNVLGLMLTRVTDPRHVEIDHDDLDAPLLGVVPEDADAATEGPLVSNAEESPAAQAYRDLTAVLIRGLEAGEIPDDVDPVFEESWFGAMADDDAGEAAEEAGEDDEDDENADNLNMFRPRF
jgi:septum site-determining protein MinD